MSYKISVDVLEAVNDIEEDIVSDTVTYQIYQKLNQMEGNK